MSEQFSDDDEVTLELSFNCPQRSRAVQSVGYVDGWRRADPNAPGTCSFCGSLDPDEFMAAARAGNSITPTDRSYKAYVDIKATSAKFYFQHLSIAHQDELCALVNAKKIKLEHPGYFYVLPFFLIGSSK